MRAATVPEDWTVDAKAAAVLTVIQETVGQIPDPRWKAVAQAAFRLPPDQYIGQEYDSVTNRLRALARVEGTPESQVSKRADTYDEYWALAAGDLADALERRITELNRLTGGWQSYRTGAPPSPPRSLPISFERTDVLYRFEGYQGVKSISYRWLIAHAAIDHYEAVGWYYNEPDAPVQIVPLANCTLDGPSRPLPQGGRCATLKFSRELQQGEAYFFAYVTNFNSDQSCRPTILYEARGLEMRSLTVRAQFDADAMPIRCWYFDVGAQSEGWGIPEADAPELLDVAPNGYVEHEFDHCHRGRKYGLRWEWPGAA